MSLLTLAELFAGYFAVAAIFALAVLTVWIHLHGVPPLLDGTPLQSVLDDRERHRHIVDVALAEDREVAALDALWEMPARGHP
jgi:hypothetical protein